jgi:hypothetical protein
MKLATLAIVFVLAACGDDGPAYSVERLQDPNTCLDCHPTHHVEWSGSMHAYATTDPVFRAMHKRGQRETNGELGLFCVGCHAPMAVATGVITEDNVKEFDFATLDPKTDGITCYFCHNVERVTGEHNNPLQLAMDQTMRGGIKNPVDNEAHHSAYAELMDNDFDDNTSAMCGACHDIVNPLGVHVERTFAEWKTSIFATNADKSARVSCGSCHMEPFTGVVADAPGVTSREFGRHDHKFPAIDQALVDFPQITEQDEAVRSFLEGSSKIVGPAKTPGTAPPGGICNQPNGIYVRIDGIGIGHNFPSGSAFDRRAWLEVKAYDAEVGGNVIYSSGVVPDGMDPEQIGDPELLGLWDRAKKSDGSTAHFLWEVASIEDRRDEFGRLADVLTPATTNVPTEPEFDHSVDKLFMGAIPFRLQIKRIEARLLVRPLSYEVLHDLEASGDLDLSTIADQKTLVVSTSTWLESTALPSDSPVAPYCNPR